MATSPGATYWIDPDNPTELIQPVVALADSTAIIPSTAIPAITDKTDKRFKAMFPDYGRTYTSFSGCDIIVQAFSGTKLKKFAELQTISYSVHREKFPVRTLGRVNPKGFTRGSRTIAGSLIFTIFDRNALWDILTTNRNDPPDTPGHSPLIDQIPPIDITITFQNEMGYMAAMRIYGIEIVDEGQTMSIDDIITENVMSYIARDITVMAPSNLDSTGGGEWGPDGKQFKNQGIFFSPMHSELATNGVFGTLREIGALEALLVDTTDPGERQVIIRKIRQLKASLADISKSRDSYNVTRLNNSDPIGPYVSPWTYLDLR